MENIQQELIKLKEEIRDLKTAQAIPSILRTYTETVIIPIGDYNGVYTWTITFEDTNDTNAPLVYVPATYSLLQYRNSDNTMRIEWVANNQHIYSTDRFTVYSSRPIYDINRNF